MKIGDRVAVIEGTQRGRVGVIIEGPKWSTAGWDYWVKFEGKLLPFGFMKGDLIKYDATD